MEQNAQRNGIINLLVLLAAGVCLYAVVLYTHSFAGRVGIIFIELGILVTLASVFQMRLEDRERVEKLEFDELIKSAANTALFNAEQTETFPARRSREQFERFFIPIFTVLLFLLQLAGALLSWRMLDNAAVTPLKQPLVAMGLIGIFALVLFLIGKYSVGLARLAKQRLLRPSASYLLLGSYISAVVLAGIAAYEAGFASVDLILARVFAVALGLFAMETLVTLVLEIYRPRVKGKVGPPLYEGRIVGALGQPDGLFTTITHALDYQFGFKVSETWLFQFLKRAMLWIVPAQLSILLLSTAFVFIETGEEALLERFGRPVTVLGAGLNFKFPWPIDRVYRYASGQIQSFNIGFVHDEKEEAEQKSLLWTVSHYKDEFNLLVASRDTLAITNGGKRSPPVNLLSASIPVQFQITNVTAWAYNNRDPAELLEKIGTREVVRYLVSVDLHEMMSSARFAAGEELRKRIQEAANALNLGAKIVFVGLQDVHPPVKVASAYEAVVGARQKKEADILKAKAFGVETNALAQSTATVKINDAAANRKRTEAAAFARAALFTNQIPAYKAAPRTYSVRAYLQALIRSGGGSEKVIMTATNTQEVILLDLQKKIRRDLLENLPLPRTP
jgi:modulator of FtsH protease HflK